VSKMVVQGIGWIRDGAYGVVRQRRRVDFSGRETLQTLAKADGLFAYPVANWGRFNAAGRLTCCACALALRDAGIAYAAGTKIPGIGLLGTAPDGSLEANREYFKDYVDSGRTLARGNLFIYTLPSSALAEAAIHFGLQGPMTYLYSPAEPFAALLATAAGMIAAGEATAMLAVAADATGAVCHVLGPRQAVRDRGLEPMEDVIARTRGAATLAALIGACCAAAPVRES